VFGQPDDERLQVCCLNETLRLIVEVLPLGCECINVFLEDRQLSLASLIPERVDDDSNKQVEEHLDTKNDETYKEQVGQPRVPALVGHESICSIGVIVHGVFALEHDALLPPKIEHHRVPCLTGGAAEEQQERVEEVLKVCMVV
jgi:hypothetical protein